MQVPEIVTAERLRSLARTWVLKKEVINHYGGRCSCCGESEMMFLAMDHINNDGCGERKEDPSKYRINRWLKKNRYPDGYQILCHNCNLGKHFNKGVCPHAGYREGWRNTT
jgi:hypothetical protein